MRANAWLIGGGVLVTALAMGCTQHAPPRPGGLFFTAPAPTGVLAALPGDVFSDARNLANACERNDISSCNRLAYLYQHGASAPRPWPKAGHEHEPDGGHHGLVLGSDVPRDPARAYALYQVGCDRGYMTSCVALADMPQGASAAADVIRRACLDYRDAESCLRFAEGLRTGDIRSQGVTATQVLTRLCNAQVPAACQQLHL